MASCLGSGPYFLCQPATQMTRNVADEPADNLVGRHSGMLATPKGADTGTEVGYHIFCSLSDAGTTEDNRELNLPRVGFQNEL